MLIEKGADVNAVDRKKKTPMDYLNKAMKKRSSTLANVHKLLMTKVE
jgi:hypothetical protein